jgi:deoxyribodipyrimidine photolyase-related protein
LNGERSGHGIGPTLNIAVKGAEMTPNDIQRIIYIPFDQLNRSHGALIQASKKSDLILLVESERMVDPKKYHKQRLFFLVASARHFAAELVSEGFHVAYVKAKTTGAGIAELQALHPAATLLAATQSSYRLQRTLEERGSKFVENDFFLTPRQEFLHWATSQKSHLMENFYRKQRVQLNILIADGKPVGGQWNFDKDNREALPKGHQFAPYLRHERDEIDSEVAAELTMELTSDWATTRSGALRQLTYFLENHFANFGRYEDAMTAENWAVHHSLLSPYINNGLLHPLEVVDAALAEFEKGSIPIAACEALIRQIIGWREYINGMYWYLGEEYRERNALNATRKLLPLFNDPDKTQMNCMKSIVSDIQERAWVHHIPRLMVLSNLALIAGVNPQEYLGWMREIFIDASDWVMVPNVIGMGVHADDGVMMTKPYAAGGAYISRMSNYCKGCHYDPKKRTGDDACPFTTLYWDFLARHNDTFTGNHRMAQQLAGMARLSDLPELQQRAAFVLQGLEQGSI